MIRIATPTDTFTVVPVPGGNWDLFTPAGVKVARFRTPVAATRYTRRTHGADAPIAVIDPRPGPDVARFCPKCEAPVGHHFVTCHALTAEQRSILAANNAQRDAVADVVYADGTAVDYTPRDIDPAAIDWDSDPRANR